MVNQTRLALSWLRQIGSSNSLCRGLQWMTSAICQPQHLRPPSASVSKQATRDTLEKKAPSQPTLIQMASWTKASSCLAFSSRHCNRSNLWTPRPQAALQVASIVKYLLAFCHSLELNIFLGSRLCGRKIFFIPTMRPSRPAILEIWSHCCRSAIRGLFNENIPQSRQILFGHHK